MATFSRNAIKIDSTLVTIDLQIHAVDQWQAVLLVLIFESKVVNAVVLALLHQPFLLNFICQTVNHKRGRTFI